MLVLNNDDYTFSNCMLWGVFNKHCQSAGLACSVRAYKIFFKHAALAALELFPIISQIVSIAEKCFVALRNYSMRVNEEKESKVSCCQFDSMYTDPIRHPNNPITEELVDRECILIPSYVYMTDKEKDALVEAKNLEGSNPKAKEYVEKWQRIGVEFRPKIVLAISGNKPDKSLSHLIPQVCF